MGINVSTNLEMFSERGYTGERDVEIESVGNTFNWIDAFEYCSAHRPVREAVLCVLCMSEIFVLHSNFRGGNKDRTSHMIIELFQ